MYQFRKKVFIVGIILVLYGYLCRLIPINFFWDSKTFGWILLIFVLLFYWIELRKKRKQNGKKTGWLLFGIIIISFGLTIITPTIILIKNSEAYITAIDFLKTDPTIKEKVGNVKSFGLIPFGGLQSRISNGVETGNASFQIIVNGSKKNMDVTIYLLKQADSAWVVTYVR